MSNEKYDLNFLVLGETSSGKSNLIWRVVNDTYSETHSPYTADGKLITVELADKKVKCCLYDDNSHKERLYNWGKTLRRMNGVLLTVDMTDENALEKAKEWIKLIERHGVEGTPIIIVGTKADDKPNQRITQNDLVEFVQAYSNAGSPVFGPQISSAKSATGTDNLLTFASQVIIENNPTLKLQRTTKDNAIKTGILPELEVYTSGFNKFLAYIKAIFSLGFFSLGLKKQQKAEELKAELNNPGADAGALVEKYKQRNKKLVSDEIGSSNLFVKSYIKQELSGEVKRNEGNLGEILDKYSSPSKK